MGDLETYSKKEMENLDEEAIDKPKLISDFESFLRKVYYKKLLEAADGQGFLVVDFREMDQFSPELAELLINKHETFFEIISKSLDHIQLSNKVDIRFSNVQNVIAVRDLRAKHIGKFLCIEGIVKRASEIRPEVMESTWECPECKAELVQERKGNFIGFPAFCDCGNKKGFKQKSKKMIDTRWIFIEEPFELTEGERPSQVTVLLKEGLVNPEGRRLTEPGNRLKISGVLLDIPKSKSFGIKLDFYLDANHAEATEVGWSKLEITKEDEERIKRLAADNGIYKTFVDSLAPSIYGMEEIKEAIILQLFSGVQRILKDNTRLRGEIHLLLIGDPSSGKSQILKLVPQIVPRGKYVSGKGASGAGLTATVSKDEQFMGGWVLEAGAMVLAHKGLLAIDEFEKMDIQDQVSMHEALEQGCYEAGTEIILDDGTTEKIGDFVDRFTKGETGERITKDISDKNIYLLSSDFSQIKPSKAKAVGKHIEEKLHSVTLNTGQEITITPDHPVFKISGGKIIPVKASELKTGDYIPVPKRLPVSGRPQALPVQEIPRDNKHKQIRLPEKTSPELCEWIGLIVAEGNAEVNRKTKNGVCFTNTDKDILDRYNYLLQKLFSVKPFIYTKNSVSMVRVVSRPLFDFVHSIGPDILARSWEKELPGWADKISSEETTYLLRGLFDGEGSVNYKFGTISFTSTSNKLAKQVQKMLLRFGIFSGMYEDRSMKGKRKHKAYKIQISGKGNIRNFAEFIGFVGKRRYLLEKLVKKKTVSSSWDHVPTIMPSVELVRKSLRMSYDEMAGQELLGARKRDNLSKNMLGRIVKNFDHRISRLGKILKDLGKENISYHEFRKLREESGISRSEISRKLHMSEQELWYWKAVKGDMDLFRKSVEEAKLIISKMVEEKDHIQQIKFVLQAPVEWVKIKSIDVKNRKQWVYDIEMNPTGIFIGNGIICHNSVSIAKASIVATLPAQTSVLAGGNPKFSRFDPYLPIAKQLTIPDTLLSRFDLKFILKDIPHEDTDKKITEHLLKARDEDYEGLKPKLDAPFVRKYVAYAKERIKPRMTKEVGRMLKNFYVDQRKRAEGGSAPIPITLRQFEALIRLSEASAKIQLSEVVRKEDADRAIKLMRFSLKQLGMDPDTGMIDIDRTEGSTPASERSHIRIILDIINDLSVKKKEVLIAEIFERARKDGINDCDEIIDKLKREGMLFEPSPGHVQKV